MGKGCESCGMGLWEENPTNLCDTCTRAQAMKKENTSKLKLFTCRVIYTDPSARNTWFTILDVSSDAAHETCERRLKRFKQLIGRRGHVSTIHVTEIEGPFNAGQILHEER